MAAQSQRQRGKCTIPPEAYQVNGAPDTLTDGTNAAGRTPHAFSMKDLALTGTSTISAARACHVQN
jgi:hypothetical protein